MIEQNRWSACRHGVEGSMIDLDTGQRFPTRDLLKALLADLGEASAEFQSQGELAAAAQMAERNGAMAQRSAAQPGGARAVAEWLAQCFLDSPDG
jgi:carboxylate-amine ligase